MGNKKYKDITNYNYKGQHHGYQGWYSEILSSYPVRVNMKNGKYIGYEEDAWNKKTNFHIR